MKRTRDASILQISIVIWLDYHTRQLAKFLNILSDSSHYFPTLSFDVSKCIAFSSLVYILVVDTKKKIRDAAVVKIW